MSRTSTESRSDTRAIRGWLMAIAGLIALMVLVGGATRLTESGLSIVEWKPVTGTIPPLNAQQWNEAFDGYKAIPQYRELNAGMTLHEFKTIFWWEWSHRLLGRIIGAAYLLPFLWFMWRGMMPAELKRRLWLIFGLGALQGAVGWWMVASGLTARVEVSQYRLATHLILALLIFAAIVWTVRRLSIRRAAPAPWRLRVTSAVLLGMVFLQLYLGALVAGLRAGRVYNTWPSIDGGFIPSGARLFFEQPWWRNLFDNTLTVQFNHRMVAYALWIVAILHAIDAVRARVGAGGAVWLAIVLTIQATLGILTLLHQVPIVLALVHQGVAIIVLTLAVAQCERLSAERSSARAGRLSLARAD
ncbi:MAG: COX15/CtaA family protein [Xanthobacteraceae bacterium]|nr:COX15/CtaA family protein [Xanthobacteraceae bacterium]